MNNPPNSASTGQNQPSNAAQHQSQSAAAPVTAALAGARHHPPASLPANIAAKGGISHSVTVRRATVAPTYHARAPAPSMGQTPVLMVQQAPAPAVSRPPIAAQAIRFSGMPSAPAPTQRPMPPAPTHRQHPQHVAASHMPSHGHHHQHARHPATHAAPPAVHHPSGYATVPNPLGYSPAPAAPQTQQLQPAFITQRAPAAQPGQPKKPKVVLSPEARQALARAIWSAIRSPSGTVAPEALNQAIATGLPRNAILNAAKVAREREAMKRRQQQAQQQAQRQQQAQSTKVIYKSPPSHTPFQQPVSKVSAPASRAPIVQQQVQPQPQSQTRPPSASTTHIAVSRNQHGVVPSKPVVAVANPVSAPAATDPVAKPAPASSTAAVASVTAKAPAAPPKPSSALRKETTSASNKATTTKSTSSTASSSSSSKSQNQLRIEERNQWHRAHSGSFILQKGRFLALPNSVSTVIRTQDLACPIPLFKKRVRQAVMEKAGKIQRLLAGKRKRPEAIVPLSDPEKFKRIRMEPKRVAKSLDRALRKSRATTVEGLVKQQKELNKVIVAHQTDFFKYHKGRRAEAARLAKAVRDRFNKEIKSKQKEEDQAERARLAALRANDMAAYSKLLEDTKNDRLKFLLDKTDECITQISSLLQQRSDQNAADFAAASESSQGSYYASAHLKIEEVRQPSILVGGDLKEYQLAGLQWMVSLYNNKLNGILADEMGLGKTIQAIALIAYLMEVKDNLGPFLVIVPLSTLSNWTNEFVKWVPSARVVVYKGTPAQRRELYKDEVRNGQFNILLTTYEYVIKDKSSLRKIVWQYAIVDEGHRMKNAQSKFAVTLGTQYTTKNRLLLTGTPLQNNLLELWALVNFLLPKIFGSKESFDQWFNRPFASFGSNSNAEEQSDQILGNEERMLIIHRLHELLRPFMLRRVKSEVLDQLPEKVEKVLRCELSSWQKELYKQISAKAVADKSLIGTFVEQPTRGLNNVVMQLRKVCNHPYLFSPQGYHINDSLIRSSGKLEMLDRMLPKLRAAGHRVLMFTQMTAVMTILEDYFAYRGYASLRLDGSTTAEEREKRMYKYNAPDSPYFIFLLSTRAGGLGLNLASADTVIIFDSDWNPMMDLQAQDRAHRIGQRNDVSVFRMVTYSPVEEKILSRATEKLNMSELVVEAGKFDKSSVEQDNSLERKRMMEVLLTDFDSSGTNKVSTSTTAETRSDDGDEEDDDDASNVSDKGEDLNDLLSNNEADYQLYKSLDNESNAALRPTLFTDEADVPDWIKYPNGSKGQALEQSAFDLAAGRKRKDVSYDDGLTEKQFLRMMDKQIIAEEDSKKAVKAARAVASSGTSTSTASAAATQKPGLMTDWTFRKLINVCKTVVALKDPATKRRLSDIFLEKPDPNMYPDYYQIIAKPIAINDILRKCRGHLYANLDEFWGDWKVLFSNAVEFNGEGSWVANDSKALKKELERVMKKQGFDTQQPPPPKKKKALRLKISLKKAKASKASS